MAIQPEHKAAPGPVTAIDTHAHVFERGLPLATRRRYRNEAVCVIKGTVPEEQGKGYMTLLSRELLRNLRDGGYRTLRGTYIETVNVASAAQADGMGGGPLHGVTFYARDVA